MKNLILAAVATVAICFTTPTVEARHYHHRRVVRHHAHVPHHVARHYIHRYVPVYPRHHVYAAPHHHHNYHYARPYYSGGGVGVYGGHFSIRIGF